MEPDMRGARDDAPHPSPCAQRAVVHRQKRGPEQPSKTPRQPCTSTQLHNYYARQLVILVTLCVRLSSFCLISICTSVISGCIYYFPPE